MEKITFTVKETAEALGLSLTKTYALVRRHDFPAVQVGTRWVVPVASLKEWLEKQAKEKGSL